jgi:hypothetical protein
MAYGECWLMPINVDSLSSYGVGPPHVAWKRRQSCLAFGPLTGKDHRRPPVERQLPVCRHPGRRADCLAQAAIAAWGQQDEVA